MLLLLAWICAVRSGRDVLSRGNLLRPKLPISPRVFQGLRKINLWIAWLGTDVLLGNTSKGLPVLADNVKGAVVVRARENSRDPAAAVAHMHTVADTVVAPVPHATAVAGLSLVGRCGLPHTRRG